MALIGNTIEFIGYFVDVNGVKTQADNVSLEISDSSGIIETIVLTENEMDTQKRYIKKYIIPDGRGSLNVRLIGYINSYPQIGSVKISREKY